MNREIFTMAETGRHEKLQTYKGTDLIFVTPVLVGGPRGVPRTGFFTRSLFSGSTLYVGPFLSDPRG